MRQFHLAYGDAPFLGRAVPEMASAKPQSGRSAILGQAVPEANPKGLSADSGAIPPGLELLLAVPWGQNLLILKKLTDPGARFYYLRATARFGWSRNVLLNQIKAGAYERAVTMRTQRDLVLLESQIHGLLTPFRLRHPLGPPSPLPIGVGRTG